jgi:hypothetical protein
MVTFLNLIKLDRTPTTIQTKLPVYITLTTIPSRLSNTMKLIQHFLTYVKGFEKIILNIPWRYKRWPNFNVQILNTILDSRFILNRTEDMGPFTKIFGALHLIPEESITIICDDMCYKLNAFKDIAEKQDRERHKSFSFYIYPYKGSVYVPQGADLISAYTKNFSHLPHWFNQFKAKYGDDYSKSPCFYVDDQLIGWYLQSHNIPLEQVDRTHRMVYIKQCDIADKKDNLNQQTGEKSREHTMEKCFDELAHFQTL